MTTDTVEKTAFARLEVDGQEIRIAATCKGSGMIHPQLVPHATMLVYILTDADATPAVLDGYLRQAIEVSFNRISVDGDTSTNDTVLLLASGASGVTIGAGNRRLCRRVDRGMHLAGAPDRRRRRGHHPCRRTAHRGRGQRRRRPESRQGHRAFAAGEDRVGGMRSELGTAGGGHRLLGRADRSRSASTSGLASSAFAATAAAPRSSTRRPRTPTCARKSSPSPSI